MSRSRDDPDHQATDHLEGNEVTEPDERFAFNGVDGTSGAYLSPAMSADEVLALVQGREPDEIQAEAVARHERHEPYPVREGCDPKDLASVGWGIVFAADTDPAVREALQPLIEHRRRVAASTDERRFRVFAGEEGLRRGDRKASFLRRHQAPTSGPVDPDRMPYYLLLVGDQDQIPVELQAQLDIQHGVGRLWFEAPEDYANYARSVVASETGDVKVARRLGMLGVRNPDDRATELSAEGLIAGLGRYVRERVAGWSVDLRVEEHATKAGLTALLGGEDTPAVLFTASHGMGFHLGDPRQLPHQGALLCQDWPGPRAHSGPVPHDYYFAGEDLGRDARLAGLIAFFFACFGAGTPERDAFSHGHKGRPRTIAPHAFFAQLPLRMLSHPNGGALATVAHIERAWGCSFFDGTSGPRIVAFEDFMARLLDGHPVGSALDCFGVRYGELAAGLAQDLEELQYGEGEVTKAQVANTWTAVNDARNFIVLGDPAVRVPAVDDAEVAPRPSLSLSSRTPRGDGTQRAVERDDALASYGWFGRDKDDDEGHGEVTERDDGGIVDSLRGFVAKLGETISEALEDMTSLDVRTYVAEDPSAVTVKQGVVTGAELRAYTRVSLDGDTVMVVPQIDGEVDQELFEVHMRALAQAQAARSELMQSIVQAATGILTPKKK